MGALSRLVYLKTKYWSICMLCFIHIKTEWWIIVYYCIYFSLMLKVLTLKAKWKLLLIFNGIKHIKCSQNSLPCKVLFWWTTLYVNGHMIKSAMSRALLEFDHIVGGFIAAKSPSTRGSVIYFIITRYTSKIVYFPEARFYFRIFSAL